MRKHALLKFIAVVAGVTINIVIFSQFVFSQIGYRIQDKDGFVNLRIKPNIKSDVRLKIPHNECVIEGYRYGAWSKIMYFKEPETALYTGYVHISRIIQDTTCENIISKYKIGECWIKDLKFDYDGTFKTLFEWFNTEYLAKCDDASFADGISDFVVTQLANNWDASIANLKNHYDNEYYINFVLNHINGSCDHGDLKKILNRSIQCISSEESEICKKIFDAAKRANQEVESNE